MKNQILTITLFITSLALFSQSEYKISYTYDDAGNRTDRNIIELTEETTNEPAKEKSSEQVFKEKLGEQEITIFPNPTKGKLTVAITNLKEAQTAKMEVYSLKGERLFVKDKIRNKTKMDLSGQKPGTYILKILLNGKASTWKIVKE